MSALNEFKVQFTINCVFRANIFWSYSIIEMKSQTNKTESGFQNSGCDSLPNIRFFQYSNIYLQGSIHAMTLHIIGDKHHLQNYVHNACTLFCSCEISTSELIVIALNLKGISFRKSDRQNRR